MTPAGLLMAYGYAGKAPYVNDASATNIPFKGPLPCGTYTFGVPIDKPESTGPFSIPLIPEPQNEMYGRDGFFMHGDSREFAGMQKASDGCPIFARFARESVNSSPDRTLQVVSTTPVA